MKKVIIGIGFVFAALAAAAAAQDVRKPVFAGQFYDGDPARLEDPSPSYHDWQSYRSPRWIRGICVVCKRPRSVRFRVTFWPPLPKSSVHYV